MKKLAAIALVVVTILLIVAAVAVWLDVPRAAIGAYLNYRMNSVTGSLPKCDRVEVYHLRTWDDEEESSGPYEWSRIADTHEKKTLAGDEAEALAALWRSQTFGREYEKLCHAPAFGLRFFRNDSLLFETSVCFRCSNFTAGTIGFWGFDTETPQAAALLERLQELLPALKEKPEDALGMK